jgi:hypothetical protein
MFPIRQQVEIELQDRAFTVMKLQLECIEHFNQLVSYGATAWVLHPDNLHGYG